MKWKKVLTTCIMVKSLIDPNIIPLIRAMGGKPTKKEKRKKKNDNQINEWLNLFNVQSFIPATALAAFLTP